MDSIVLKFQTAENVVDINVDDVDKVMWIDLIIEYEELFRKNGYMMPKYPSFHYCYNKKDVKITSDSDLMSKLDRIGGSKKVITVYVGSVETPSECVVAARNLTESLKNKPNMHYSLSPPMKNNQSFDVGTSDMPDVSPPRINETLIDNWERIEEEASGCKTHKKKGKGGRGNPKPRVKLPDQRSLLTNEPLTLADTTTFSNAPLLEKTTLNPTSSNNTTLIVHKIPKTTAARKGLLNTPYEKEAQVITEEEFNRRFEHGETLRPEMNADIGDEDLDIYFERGGVSDEEEQEFGEIIDNYDAYASDVWKTELLDDDTYVSKMYKNGEFAENVEFGSIVLKPWMIFTDKAHFLSVLRDYSIQSGFAIVVDRSSPTRFTVQCLELNCNWRIHSSVLPDGTTWAIKSIKDSEHTCRGLDERNPLVNVKWAASKLIDDIRANNDITGKTLNDLLWTRYGVQMATSTLYKMRSIALREINGGHDESYGHLPR
ncbi:uncharacterized protein LOC110730976 [Chenopodium quinoa]|uniref:uncharacterized protein LOC110730976 n=1 Tax=Chenopodium quinoa TaxID=63459 RepID=UPI000B76D391|nr:uncharacterized protein LOC110730976 [Chenopodium quinoa]XP_021766519.1 uncharacterized protein LOC110730976 [Chenopodium quinoa]